ncbi:MAG TPA: 4Fe-4S binding protein [Firmicutes bacterium]|nr:4Fe-4S binding protein [Bacillota bacterium]
MKKPLVDEHWCKGCGLCISECPRSVLGWSGRRNPKGYNLPAPLAEDKCTGCRLCELICPDLAIYVVEEEEQCVKR